MPLIRYNGHTDCDGVSNHQPNDCLLNSLFKRRSKKTSKLSDTGICEGNSPVTAEFVSQKASNAENTSIRWRHHVLLENAVNGSLILLPKDEAINFQPTYDLATQCTG